MAGNDELSEETAAPASAQEQRLRERLELQFRREQHLREALGAHGRARVVTIRPALPARRDGPTAPPIPPAEPMSWWPGSDWPAQSLVPTPGWTSFSLAGSNIPVIAVLVFGLAAAALAEVVAMIADRQARSRDFRPVFLTDCPGFAPFRAHGFVIEYLPPEVYGPNPHKAPTARAAARLRLLQAKWDFGAVLDLSQPVAVGPQPAIAPALPVAAPVVASRDGKRARPVRTLAAQAKLLRGSGLFDAEWYRERYARPDEPIEDPVDHYLRLGAARGYDPHPLFQSAFYVRQMLARPGGR